MTYAQRLGFLAAIGLTPLLVPAPTIHAQTIQSAYQFLEGTHSVGVFTGIAQERRGELGIGPGGGTMIGARYGLELRGPIALELTTSVLSTDRVVYTVAPGVGLSRVGTTDMLVTAVDARFRFTLTGNRTWHAFAPLIALGGGLVGNLAGSPGFEQSLPSAQHFKFGPTFVGVMGSGVRWIPLDRFEFRADATLRIWKLGTPGGFFEVQEELGTVPEDQWVGVGAFLLGATYRF